MEAMKIPQCRVFNNNIHSILRGCDITWISCLIFRADIPVMSITRDDDDDDDTLIERGNVHEEANSIWWRTKRPQLTSGYLTLIPLSGNNSGELNLLKTSESSYLQTQD
jgi:hypothetical protein